MQMCTSLFPKKMWIKTAAAAGKCNFVYTGMCRQGQFLSLYVRYSFSILLSMLNEIQIQKIASLACLHASISCHHLCGECDNNYFLSEREVCQFELDLDNYIIM